MGGGLGDKYNMITNEPKFGANGRDGDRKTEGLFWEVTYMGHAH